MVHGIRNTYFRTWEEMENVFLEKYKDYCMPHNIKDEVFKMIRKEDENLEDFVQRFAYNVKRAKMNNLDEETLKALSLKSNRDEWIDILNLMGKGYISHLSLREICELCIHISRSKERIRKNPRDPLLSRINKSTTGIVSRSELGNFIYNFKTYILGSLSEQIDTLKIQNNQKVENVAMSIFFPKCIKKHSLRDCPLDLESVETCLIFAKK